MPIITLQKVPIALLDQEKAYWTCLFSCLERFGFGPKWITAIKTLHSNLTGSVMVNGFKSQMFEIQQGLPQGDPLSPLLYNIILEPLLSTLKKNLNGLGLGT